MRVELFELIFLRRAGSCLVEGKSVGRRLAVPLCTLCISECMYSSGRLCLYLLFRIVVVCKCAQCMQSAVHNAVHHHSTPLQCTDIDVPFCNVPCNILATGSTRNSS